MLQLLLFDKYHYDIYLSFPFFILENMVGTSNLCFNTPLPIADHQLILLDNLQPFRNNPKNLTLVLHTISNYFHNKNKSISQNITPSSVTSQVFKPYMVKYFIEQDRKIKFLETKVKILKEKEVKLEKRINRKIRKIEQLKEFIQKTKKEEKKKKNFKSTPKKSIKQKKKFLNQLSKKSRKKSQLSRKQ